MGNVQFNGTPEEWDALVKKNRQVTVKLYTEEQVRHAYNEGCWNGFNEVKDKEDYTISSLTPIELPSDEEIDKKSFERLTLAQISGFRLGAKWMRDKILNK